MTEAGLRALNYVQDEIRHLSAIDRTREGDHALLVFRLMLMQVWGKEFRDGEFIFVLGDAVTDPDDDRPVGVNGGNRMTPAQIAREIDRAAIQKFYCSQFQRRRRGERCRDVYEVIGVMIGVLAIYVFLIGVL